MPLVTVGDRTALFIHVPKTAGMSIDRFLHDNGQVTGAERLTAYGHRLRLRHLHAEPLQQLYGPACFDWVFMVVRHPVARLISEYRYQRRKGGLHPQNFAPFGLWLRVCLARAARNASARENHFRPQVDFRAFDAEVFRLEDGLEALEHRFAEVMGVSDPTPMQHVNRAPQEAVRPTADDLARIAAFYRADFEAFGYTVQEDAA